MIINSNKGGKSTKDATITEKHVFINEVAYGKNGKIVGSAPLSLNENGYTGKLPTCGTWTDVCYGDDKFVAISQGNKFAYSYDGVFWTEINIGETAQWRSICYGNGVFVAVPSGFYDQHIHAYSSDGINWCVLNDNNVSHPSHDICYGNGQFTAFCGDDKDAVMRSYDGVDWTRIEMSGTQWRSICYGNNMFVATGIDVNPRAFISTDCIEWSIYNVNNIYTYTCYGNNIFVAVGYDGTLAYSYDCIEWERITIGDANVMWNTVCYCNNMFFATPYDSNVFAYSYNGIDWTEFTVDNTRASQHIMCGNNDKFVIIASAYDEPMYSYDGFNQLNKTDVYKFENTSSGMLMTAENCDTRHMVVEHRDSGWVYHEYPISQRWYLPKFSDGMFITNSYDGTFVYSSDCISWSVCEHPCSITDVCYGNGKFVVSCQASDSNNQFAYSTNGVDWIYVPSEGVYSGRICYGNGIFVAPSGQGLILSSHDAINWNYTSFSYNSNAEIYYYNGIFVLFDPNTPNEIAKSTDGVNWTEVELNTDFDYAGFGYGNGKFTINDGQKIAVSDDCVTWDLIETNYNESLYYNICGGSGIYVAISSGGIVYSEDLINWLPFDESEIAWNINGYNIIYGNGKFFISNYYGGWNAYPKISYREYNTKLKFADETDKPMMITSVVDVEEGSVSPYPEGSLYIVYEEA